MIKKVFRPFWSLDIITTETWLSEMASRGYKLVNVNFITRKFVFEDDEQKTIQYRIYRHKTGVSGTSPSLINSQWYSVFTKGKWSVLANENDASELKIYPSRESILKRNRTLEYSIGLLLAYLVFTQLQFILILSPNGSSQFWSPSFILSRLLILSLLSLIIIKLIVSDKQIRKGKRNGYDLNKDLSLSLNGKTERAIGNKAKITKKKFAWIYAPDKVEKWLEEMELEGYNLTEISWLGNAFHFIKGETRTIKYCLDYQYLANDSYFEIHKSNRWEMMFTSQSFVMKYTLWRKKYTYKRPQLYSDKSQILKHARKVCVQYCSLSIPLIVIGFYIIMTNVRTSLTHPYSSFSWTSQITSTILIIEFGYVTVQSLGYYLRTRKRINS